MAANELGECLELALLPTRVIEVLVEDDDGPVDQQWREMVEYGLGRTVEITINVNEGDRGLAAAGHEFSQRVFEDALDQDDVVADRREATTRAERSGTRAECPR